MKMENYYEDLTIAMLAVNAYPINKVLRVKEGLRKQGFFASGTVSKWDHPTAMARLISSGYDRGGYNPILASRLQELALFTEEQGAERIRNVLQKGDRSEINKLLRQINGVGPAVLENFWILQEENA